MSGVPEIAFLAPFFLVFELVQLVASERLVGVKQIERGSDPRLDAPSQRMAAIWTITLTLYWLWLGMMMVPNFARAHVIVLLATSLVGYALRRNAGLKWILVILTFEGAIRIGILVALIGRIWRRMY
ncbi:hypothetical protein [Synoicihabitans lomoniglobus]|uniref:Uncharacterized protein n=1 Tax=Synoicihabitans lomoniglobus TaxID=2909285 RepID=A0AAF0I5P3_9BACT|nr:hypothetical protein [Opitutaceae bacterium LMO-M01]WED67468.1 hypothetical protein PXH66_11465 [Opitutaceae bacterium LMO-M01]